MGIPIVKEAVRENTSLSRNQKKVAKNITVIHKNQICCTQIILLGVGH